MSWFGRQLGRILRPRPTAKPRAIRAGYDAASYDLANEKHWQSADSYSPNAQLDSGTRQLLRDRSRYEAANNGYYGGVIETIAGDTVGSGPRPQVTIPGDDGRKLGRLFENWFRQWGQASAWAEDLTLMQEAEVRDGESFGVIVDNPGLIEDGRTKVSLDLAIYEAEQVSDPWDYGFDPLYADGVRVDSFGNPTEYTFLKNHPGGVSLYRGWETETIPAWQVCHWYKRRRAGQTRGVPWMVAALPLFAQLRRYTLATLSAAELAAMLAGVMKTDAAAGEQAVTVEAMDSVAMVRGALLTLPSGWDASQFKPEQPVTSYGQFKTEILNEVGRGGNVPLNIVSGNSSGYNYSSARLDRQLYYAAIRRQRERMAARFLDRVFLRWAREAVIAYGIECPPPEQWSWTWFWDGIVSIDPQKDAEADAKNLENNTTTLAEICAERGLDWEEVVKQRAAEKRLIEESQPKPPEPDQGAPVEQPPDSPVVANGFVELEAARVFDESKVKRSADGKFGSGGAGGAAKKAATPKKAPAAKKAPAKKPAAKKTAPAKKPAAKKAPAKKAVPAGGEPPPAAKKKAPAKKAAVKKPAAPKKKAAPKPKKAPAKKAEPAPAAETVPAATTPTKKAAPKKPAAKKAPAKKSAKGPNPDLPGQARPRLTAGEKEAVGEYTASAFRDVNATLQGRDLPGVDAARAARVHESLSAAFARAKPFPAPVPVVRYMGESGSAGVQALIEASKSSAVSGQTFAMPGYLSTTTATGDTSLASRFGAKQGGVRFVIAAKKGLDLSPHSSQSLERELLLPHASRFKATKVVQDQATKNWDIHLEHVL